MTKSGHAVNMSGVGQMENSTVWPKEEISHPLQTSWAFWYDAKKGRSHRTAAVDYAQKLHKIGSFDTVEDFWKLYLFMKRPSKLDLNVNMYLFRDGPKIAPMWECFPNGGCWILKIRKKKVGEASVLG